MRGSLFAGILAAGLLVRVLALPLPGTEDVNVWKVWSYAASQDVTGVYGIGGNPPVRGLLHYGRAYTTVDYPPVALYELALAGAVYRAIFPEYPNTWTLTACVKLPGLLAGMALTALLYAAALQRTQRRPLAQAAALAYWLNPATILNAEVLGYLDPLMMLPAVAAFVLLHDRHRTQLPSPSTRHHHPATATAAVDARRTSGESAAAAHADNAARDAGRSAGENGVGGTTESAADKVRVRTGGGDEIGVLRSVGAGVCLAIAVLTKPQAVLIVPAFALALWHVSRRSWRPIGLAIGAGVAAALVLIAPYVWVGAVRNMWLAFGSFTVRRDILSGDAANVWWIANYVSRAVHMVHDLGWRAFLVPVPRPLAISSFMDQGLPDPRPFGQIAVLTLWAWALWRLRHADDLGRHLLGAAFLVHAFFVLAVGVHEHHQMLMVPLLALAAILRPRLRPLFVAISLICALNMNLFYGLGRGIGWAVPRGLTLIDATVTLSCLNILALAWHAWLVGTSTPESSPAATRAVSAASGRRSAGSS